jgi:hypothetical protein
VITTTSVDTATRVRAGIVFGIAVLAAGGFSDASAQPRERVSISLNGASQATDNPFSDRFEFPVDRETASTESHYPVKGGVLIDGSIALRVWRNIGAGVAVSHFVRDGTATTDSRLPHPLYFASLRTLAGDVRGVSRTERGIHVQALYRFAFAAPITVTLFGGPSIIRVEQDVVSAIQYNESFPYDQPTFGAAETRPVRGSAVGFNAGADVAWMFARHVGVGGVARFARATVDLDLPGGRSKAVDAGGLSGGAGLRVVF